jgi:hypothetical protein
VIFTSAPSTLKPGVAIALETQTRENPIITRTTITTDDANLDNILFIFPSPLHYWSLAVKGLGTAIMTVPNPPPINTGYSYG